MKKDLAIILGLFLLIAVILVFGSSFSTTGFLKSTTATSAAVFKDDVTVPVVIGDLKINAKVASSANTRKKGLSKKSSIPLDSGMIFAFETQDKYGIWMKDMKFAIDILWVDNHKNIVAIAAEVPPQPGKGDKELTVYKPSVDSLYVLEINAGLSKLYNINVGDKVIFETPK